MKPILILFLPLWVIFHPKESQGQISLGIPLEKFQPKSNFIIEKVMVSPKVIEGLGKINVNGQEAISVKIKGNPIQIFKQSFDQLFLFKDTKDGIIYDIQLLEIRENALENRKYSGTMQLKVAFKKNSHLMETILCETSASTSYIRSESSNPSVYFESILGKLVVKTLGYIDNWMLNNATKHESFLKETRIIFLDDLAVNQEDTLSFEVRKINWDDFKGYPTNQQYGAAIFTNFAYTAKFSIENSAVVAKIQTHTYMVRGMSWAKSQAKDEYGLAHEQLHFDITKLIVERFKKKIKLLEQEIQSIDDLNSRIQYEYLESYREMNAMQRKYDTETRHSLNHSAQEQWSYKIKKELEAIY